MNKVTKESIQRKIAQKEFKRLSPKLTHCILTMENGFQVTGESACVDPANYDQEIGERIAYENAFEKIWVVEGYLLQETLYQMNRVNKLKGNSLYPMTPTESLKVPEVTDELSFMEKAETLEIENLQGAFTYTEKMIRYNKLYRRELDLIIQSLKGSARKSPERSTAIRKATEAVMWLGMDLKSIGTPNPYPESKNPENTKIEPTADGLKL